MKQPDNDSSLLSKLHEWDSDWGEKYRRISSNPWSSGVLPVKLIELICLALNSTRQRRADAILRRSELLRAQIRRRTGCRHPRAAWDHMRLYAPEPSVLDGSWSPPPPLKRRNQEALGHTPQRAAQFPLMVT